MGLIIQNTHKGTVIETTKTANHYRVTAYGPEGERIKSILYDDTLTAMTEHKRLLKQLREYGELWGTDKK